MQSVIWDEAIKINGADPDFHRRDLFEAIAADDFPKWDFGVQLFDEQQAASFDFDVLDATKLVPEELLPLKIVGRWSSTATQTIFLPRLSKSRFARQMSCPASTSATTRYCRVGCSPTSIHS